MRKKLMRKRIMKKKRWKFKIIDHTYKLYMHKLESILENETYKIFWDCEIQKDCQIEAKIPDLAFVNKNKILSGFCCACRPQSGSVERSKARQISGHCQRIKNNCKNIKMTWYQPQVEHWKQSPRSWKRDQVNWILEKKMKPVRQQNYKDI